MELIKKNKLRKIVTATIYFFDILIKRFCRELYGDKVGEYG